VVDGDIPGGWQLRRLIESRLRHTAPCVDPAQASLPVTENTASARARLPEQPLPAAVLIPIVERAEGLTLLFTQRAAHLRRHAGQISFPGGRVESQDSGPTETALRETEEEIGLDRRLVSVSGFLQPLLTMTGFCVCPVVGFIAPGFALRPDPSEVHEVFEVPLLHILNKNNHIVRERTIGEHVLRVQEIHYGERHIWGATAGIVMLLFKLIVDTPLADADAPLIASGALQK